MTDNTPDIKVPAGKTYDGPYGYTYFYDAEGDLIACPTLSIGGYDAEAYLYVSDFCQPLTKRQLERVKEKLA